jgi:hypothetical protein
MAWNCDPHGHDSQKECIVFLDHGGSEPYRTEHLRAMYPQRAADISAPILS